MEPARFFQAQLAPRSFRQMLRNSADTLEEVPALLAPWLRGRYSGVRVDGTLPKRWFVRIPIAKNLLGFQLTLKLLYMGKGCLQAWRFRVRSA